MKRFLVLDSFRGLCAAAVVIHHSYTLQGFSQWAFFRNAHYLVEFFFVLSGFVISHAYAGRLSSPRQLGRFVSTRTWRIYPLHLAMLLAAIGLELVKLAAERAGVSFGADSFSGPRASAEILPNLLLVQSWWPGFNPLSFNYPAWSISVEFWLYLLFGLLSLALPGRIREVFCALAIGAFLALYLGAWLPTEMALKGVGCFFAGCVTHALYQRMQDLHLDTWRASALELSLLAASLLALSRAGDGQSIGLALLFCLVIGVFAFEAGLVSRLLGSAPFAWLGRLSYSIYMTHALLLMLVSMAAGLAEKVVHQPLIVIQAPDGVSLRYFSSGSVGGDNLFLLAQLALVLGVSLLTWRLIEQPGIAMGKRLGRLPERMARPDPA